MTLDLVRVAWEALMRLDPPEPTVVYGDREDAVHPSRVDNDDRAEWYRRGSEAQASDRSSVLSRYPAHWTLDDDNPQDYGAEHTRVLSIDAYEFEEDEALFHPLYSDDDAVEYDGETDEFLASIVEVAGLTRREAQVAAWIASGNAIAGVEYAERLAEALGNTPLAARKAVERLRSKLVDHWAS